MGKWEKDYCALCGTELPAARLVTTAIGRVESVPARFRIYNGKRICWTHTMPAPSTNLNSEVRRIGS